MPSDLDGLCPYAPSANVLTIIHQMRERGLKEPVTMQLITTAGVAEGNASRTIQALRFLNLVDEEGYHTPTFRLLENAPSNEYPEVLGRILTDAYKNVFMVLDPATASDEKLENAFRYYQPKAQRQRMISLFKGLCREAGLITGSSETTKRSRNVSSNKTTIPLNSRKQSVTERTTPQIPENGPPVPSQMNRHYQHGISQEYTLLLNLLQQLPTGEEKQWTKTRRDKWLQAVTANIDLLIEVKEEECQGNTVSRTDMPHATGDEKIVMPN